MAIYRIKQGYYSNGRPCWVVQWRRPGFIPWLLQEWRGIAAYDSLEGAEAGLRWHTE